jgi:predicted O-methyltransferase YrrM
MDSQSTILSVENNVELVAIAQAYLGKDSRTTFHVGEVGDLIEQLSSGIEKFDMIFVDTWAGKYSHFEELLQCLKSGWLYVIDDMLPQSNLPEGHELKVNALSSNFSKRRSRNISIVVI